VCVCDFFFFIISLEGSLPNLGVIQWVLDILSGHSSVMARFFDVLCFSDVSHLQIPLIISIFTDENLFITLEGRGLFRS